MALLRFIDLIGYDGGNNSKCINHENEIFVFGQVLMRGVSGFRGSLFREAYIVGNKCLTSSKTVVFFNIVSSDRERYVIELKIG